MTTAKRNIGRKSNLRPQQVVEPHKSTLVTSQLREFCFLNGRQVPPPESSRRQHNSDMCLLCNHVIKHTSRMISGVTIGNLRSKRIVQYYHHERLSDQEILHSAHMTARDLRKLHPRGETPAPVPHQEVPRFTEDVVRKALCSFGPGSAAGLYGYKPFLLQQCMRAESFVFTRALTSAVNEFACGRAPA